MTLTTLALVLAIVPASAQELQTTAASDVEVVNSIAYLEEKLRGAQDRSARLAKELKKTNDRIDALVLVAAKASESTDDSTSTTTDPALTEALQAAAEAKAAYEAATDEYLRLQQALADAQANPQASVQVTEVRHTTTVVEVRSAGFRPILYAGIHGVIAAPVPDVSSVFEARLTVGARPTWDYSDNYAFGLWLEGDRSVGGWGVRAIASGLTNEETGGWGLGLGAGYNCDGLTDGICAAEHIGGVGRISWEMGQGLAGVMVTGDIEVNSLIVPWDTGTEARAILGVSAAFGRVGKQKTVTVTQ